MLGCQLLQHASLFEILHVAGKCNSLGKVNGEICSSYASWRMYPLWGFAGSICP